MCVYGTVGYFSMLGGENENRYKVTLLRLNEELEST